jgi:hypothetical protein
MTDLLKCSGCSRREKRPIMKPATEFALNRKAKNRGGRSYYCKSCDTARRRPQNPLSAAKPGGCPFNIVPFRSIYEIWPLPTPGARHENHG